MTQRSHRPFVNRAAQAPALQAMQGSRATSYDVARLAGVSQSAVSRCFSPGASISPETREKVEHAANTLGYQPNALARSLITRRSGLVGFIVTTATLRYSPQIVHDISDALQRRGYLPLLTTLTDERNADDALPTLLHYQPEAIISLASTNAQRIHDARARGVPVILVNRRVPTGAPAVSIRCDHAAGIEALTQRLIAAGHRRFAFIGGPEDAPVSVDRQSGLDRALREAGLQRTGHRHADYTYEGGRSAALDLLSANPAIDALVCANDAMALGALDAVRVDLGLSVPAQVSITGFDDLAEGRRPGRAMTTVRQPTAEMADLVVAQITDGTASGSGDHLIAGELLWRATTRPA